MFRMLACDIDHTILPPGGSVSAEDIATFRELQARGVTVVLASGRATASTRAIMESIFNSERPEYLISYNGARIDSLPDEETLFASNLAPDLVREIGAWCRKNGVTLQGYAGREILVESENEYVRPYSIASGMKYRVVPEIAEAVTPAGGTPKLVCHDRRERLPHHIETLRKLARQRWAVVTSIPYFVELLAPGTNKGSALRRLANYLGYSTDEVIAFGDNLNDMEMIRDAGTGVAVANAVPELKEIADWVTTRSARESALTEVAERFF